MKVCRHLTASALGTTATLFSCSILRRDRNVIYFMRHGRSSLCCTIFCPLHFLRPELRPLKRKARSGKHVVTTKKMTQKVCASNNEAGAQHHHQACHLNGLSAAPISATLLIHQKPTGHHLISSHLISLPSSGEKKLKNAQQHPHGPVEKNISILTRSRP